MCTFQKIVEQLPALQWLNQWIVRDRLFQKMPLFLRPQKISECLVLGNRCAVSLRLYRKSIFGISHGWASYDGAWFFVMVDCHCMSAMLIATLMMHLVRWMTSWHVAHTIPADRQPRRQRKTSCACILTFKPSCNYLAKLITILDTTISMI